MVFEESDYHILRLPAGVVAGFHFIARRPFVFPMVFWIMLMMEERTLMVSRRYAAMNPEMLDPLFAATYHAHAEDEVRHVQLDWHLLERFYQDRPMWVRKINARLLEWTVFNFLLKPRHAIVRVVELLIAEFPELSGKREKLLGAVRGLSDNPGFRQMMYSTEATPLARSLFDRLPEFGSLRLPFLRTGHDDEHSIATIYEARRPRNHRGGRDIASACLREGRFPMPETRASCWRAFIGIFACFHFAARATFGWPLAAVATGFTLVMMGVYAVRHEAEHGILFANPRTNVIGGIITASFFPRAISSDLRQGHIGHHLREIARMTRAFDLWFEGESPVWKWMQWIGILTGMFYLAVVLSNVVVLVLPFLLKREMVQV